MLRTRLALIVALAIGTLGIAEDKKKGTELEVVGLKATTPATWKEEKPSNQMRLAQFKLDKEKGDSEDAELTVFISPGGGGVKANLERQVKAFKIPEGVKTEDAVKSEEMKVGDYKATYQSVTGTYQFKSAPFDPNAKVTEKEKFRQLYVIFEDDDKKVISIRLVGPEKTIEKHQKDFEAFIKSFKK